MTEINYRQVFQESADSYDALTQSKHITLIYELEKDILGNIFSQINAQDKSLLDFACGTGRWTQFLENHFNHTIGVDVSKKMVGLAKQKCTKTQFFITDITSNSGDEPLLQDQFDVITAFRFYKNAEGQLRKSATSAIAKHLKKDGLFIFDLHLNTFSIMGLLACLFRFLKINKLFKIGDLTIRTIALKDIEGLFKNSPFEIIDYYGMGIFPGRSNYTILPKTILYKIESMFTNRKILRKFAYNILVVAKKR